MNSESLRSIGRYRILRELGAGGMGVVYAAQDEALDRQVAIKTVREPGADTIARERLRREARAAAAVNHPRLCQVYEIGEYEGDLYIAMELLEGESLAARLARGACALHEALRIAAEILEALEALHNRGVVHRDLKPSNIFLTPHGIKVLDFGLARAPSGCADETGAPLTMPGTVLGSPAYMAPEQVQGRPLDVRADLFAAAVVIFEMLTGRAPFARPTVMETLHAVLYEQPPALGGSPAVAEVDRVLRRALAKQPDERYRSAVEMGQGLRAVLGQLDSGEQPRVQPMTRVMVMPFRILRPDPETEFLAFSLADAVATTLSGLGSLVVRSSMSAARFADRPFDLRAIATEAEVDVVLTGTLLRAGDRLRLSGQLLSAPDATILCSDTCQAPVGDVFELQDTLVRRIVESLAVPLTARDHRMLRQDVPASAKAYELYLRANNCFYHPQDWAVARDLYLECLREDPGYAPAWARVGRCHRLMAKFRSASREEVQQHLARAEEAFGRAFELNADLPIAHHLYTVLECDLGRATDAMLRLLARARARSGDAELFAGLVYACRFCGLLDASSAAHGRARQLDPNVATSVAFTCWCKGDYERALAQPPGTGYSYALALASAGRADDAIAYLRDRGRAVADEMLRWYFAVLRAALEGDRRAGLEAVDPATAHNPDPESVFYVARALAHLGETDRALAELERAVEGGYFCSPVFLTDRWLDPLRGDARFLRILERAEARHRDAAARFTAAGGEAVVGLAGC